MITEMKKYAFMVYHREYDGFLELLREAGAVHIQETKSPADCTALLALSAERKRVNGVMHLLGKLNAEEKEAALAPAAAITLEVSRETGEAIVARAEAIQEKTAQFEADLQAVQKEIAGMEPWGDFSYAGIERLREAGYAVTFFTCPTARFEPEWTDKYNAFLIYNAQSTTGFITVTKEGETIDIDAERAKMPDRGLKKLLAHEKRVKELIAQLNSELQALATAGYDTLEAFDRQLENEYNMSHVLEQTGREVDSRLMFLEGWTTVDQSAALEQTLDAHGYFYRQLPVAEGDKAPIKLKNNSYSRLFEPITGIFSLPNYAEIDPTPLLAPFFMLFFGLCFGDSGYGLLILLGCTLLKRKAKMKDFKPFLSLFQWLGGMTVVTGALTGSFFGVSLVELPALKAVKAYFLSSDNLMMLSIVIGIIHILFGKVVAACKIRMQKGVKYSIAPFAWVFVIVALALTFGLPVLNVHLPLGAVYACYGVAGAGLLLALLYNMPGRNVFLNFGAGLWNTYNIASGLLGDTLSYIRLFAIGLTGSILGSVFNTLAVSMTESLPLAVKLIVMLLILLVGHGINFGLCMISSLVHPLRLVFVEYYKNSEFEGGGVAYRPFKKV